MAKGVLGASRTSRAVWAALKMFLEGFVLDICRVFWLDDGLLIRPEKEV